MTPTRFGRRCGLPLLLTLGLLIPGVSWAQQAPALSLAYWGNNLWNPGLSAGLSWQQAAHPRWALAARLGGYWDPGSHTGTLVQGGWQYAKPLGQRWQYSLGISPLGVLRAGLPRTYAVSPQGEVTRVRAPGRWYAAPGLSLGLHHARGLFTRLHLLTLFPYNTAFLPQLHVEIGYQLSPSS